CQQGYDPPFSF
nr:immunoglobulin light chain junction region [Macaca mulatta]